MNRLVLIGNGFDLAHGLKTRYEDFLNWYWWQKLRIAATKYDEEYNDLLCKMTILTEDSWFSIVFYDLTLKGYLEDGDGKAVYNPIPRNFSESSLTCMVKHLAFGQIGEFTTRIVQK